jgi:hypothetical protein
MLPEQRVAALGGIVEVGADQSVEDQEGARSDHRRHRDHNHRGRHQRSPDEDGHAVERHAWRAKFENGDNELGRYCERCDLGEGDHLRIDVATFARPELRTS